MLDLPGYQIIEEVGLGHRCAVYRAYGHHERRMVIVKVLRSETPTIDESARLRQEYAALEGVEHEGVVKPYSLQPYSQGMALILEDFGGRSLYELMATRLLSIEECLRIGIALAETLSVLHQVPIVHRAIRPSNIIANLESRQIKLANFSMASRLAAEYPTVTSVTRLDDALVYMAPEQTGRTSHAVDHRSDLYALGATLYELFTQRPPFLAQEPLGLVIGHLAGEPMPLSRANPDVPEAVSAVLMKLLAKAPEDRYQSALGLAADLEECLARFQVGEQTTFVPGRVDRRSRALRPDKLYSREAELAALTAAFERVCKGRAELVLISGPPGSGRTSLAAELQTPVTCQRGHAISIACEQRKRHVPYATLLQALRALVREVLAERHQSLVQARGKLLAAIGPSGKIVTEAIPELEQVIGEQPPATEMSSPEAQHRFRRTLEELVRVLAQPEHPLVLIFDDLEWADPASVRFLGTLCSNSENAHVLVIGICAEGALASSRPLVDTMEVMRDSNTELTHLALAPLSREAVHTLVVDTLVGANAPSNAPARVSASALADRIFRITQGNPRFLVTLLETLHAEGYLRSTGGSGIWQWSMAEIDRARACERDLDQLVSASVHRLPESTQSVLQVAACIGQRFGLAVLAAVQGQSVAEVSRHLWETLRVGLVVPIGDGYKIPMLLGPDDLGAAALASLDVSYRFVHDRVREVIYASQPEPQRKRTHLKIGRMLLARSAGEPRAEQLFVLVDHLDLGRDMLMDQVEQEDVARLNLLAAKRAREAGASEVGLEYIAVGIELLGMDCWFSRHDLTMAFYMEALATEYACGNYDRVGKLAEVALRYSRSVAEQGAIYARHIDALVSQNNMEMAIEVTLRALQSLHIPLLLEPPSSLVPADLTHFPESIPTDMQIAHRILALASSALYAVGPELVSPIMFTRLHLATQGVTPRMAIGIAIDYAILLCSSPSDIDRGVQFGRLALQLIDQYDVKEVRCTTMERFYAQISHWGAPIKDSLAPLREAIQTAVERGLRKCAERAALSYCSHLFCLGENLEFVDAQCARYGDMARRLGLRRPVSGFDVARKMLSRLLGRGQEAGQPVSELFDEATDLPVLEKRSEITLVFLVHFSKMVLAYLFGDSAAALASGRVAGQYLAGVTGMLFMAEHNFFLSLALLAEYRKADEHAREELMGQVVLHQEWMQLWARHAPFNFEHRYELIEAERARALGQHREAMELYDRAIRGAEEQGCIHHKAMACELAAELAWAQGQNQAAEAYITEAYVQYDRWGGRAKLKDLEARYSVAWPRTRPEVLQGEAQKQDSADEASQPASAGPVASTAATLDLASAIQAAQEIARETELDKVLVQAARTLARSTDAEICAVVLAREDDLFIEAAHGTGERAIELTAPLAVSDLNAPDRPDGHVSEISPEIVQAVARTRQPVILDDARQPNPYKETLYVHERKPQSILCMPLDNQGELLGVLYLEHAAETGLFTPTRVDLVRLLAAQTAVAIANARAVAARMEQARKRDEQERLKQNAALEREAWELARLNVDKDKFFSIISHDLRNPFNMMLNLVEIALDDVEVLSKSEMKELLSKLHQAAESCHNLLENLLTWSRLQSGRMVHKPTAANLRAIADSTVMLLQRIAEDKGISLRNGVDQKVWIHADPHMIDMVIRNLIGNALKFTPRGGEVAVSSRQVDGAGGNGGASSLIEILVRDTGVGMKPEDMEKLFRTDVHHTTRGTANEQGTGLGLTICKEMVQQNGGQIRVESQLGEGTTFAFTVPAAAGPPERSERGDRPERGDRAGADRPN